jgi:hypothetical protein
MKINANYLKQIIKEEIQSALDDTKKVQDVISVFIRAIQLKDPNFLSDELKKLNIVPHEAIHMFNGENVDSQFYQKAMHIHNDMVGDNQKLKVNAFADFPKVGHNPTQDSANSFQKPIVPSSTAASTDDLRRYRKN